MTQTAGTAGRRKVRSSGFGVRKHRVLGRNSLADTLQEIRKLQA